MKRILVVLFAVLFSAVSINAQNKQVESNLLFSRGSFFETGSNSQRYLFNGSSDYPIPFIGTSFRVAYGLDIPLKGNWSLMPGASLRAHTACATCVSSMTTWNTGKTELASSGSRM